MILQNISQSVSSAREACRKPRSSHVMYNNFESKSPREPFCGSSRKQKRERIWSVHLGIIENNDNF